MYLYIESYSRTSLNKSSIGCLTDMNLQYMWIYFHIINTFMAYIREFGALHPFPINSPTFLKDVLVKACTYVWTVSAVTRADVMRCVWGVHLRTLSPVCVFTNAFVSLLMLTGIYLSVRSRITALSFHASSSTLSVALGMPQSCSSAGEFSWERSKSCKSRWDKDHIPSGWDFKSGY